MTGPVAGEKPGGREIPDAAQRCEVFREIAALAGGDDDRSSTPGEIAAVEVARLFVEEAEVVRRVAGRVQRDQSPVAGGDDLAVAAAVRREIQDADLGPALEQRRNAVSMVRMRVGDQHSSEARLAKRTGDGVEMRRSADAGVDERRHRTRKQVGVVPFRPGPGRRVLCGNPPHRSEIVFESHVSEVAVRESAHQVAPFADEPADRPLEPEVVAELRRRDGAREA